ncbi:zeta toxin family protein [Petrimonas sp.]|uniref:zeta toxin family protein n=1 Tax=Petrimonas sp. TaxID=2023866 RepID=UPI003F515BDF
MQKKLYIIAGCNGAGKTTASYTILPEILECREFVNADEIARGLSPFQPEKVAIEAGRIMLNRIDELTREGENFAFETTLATKSYKQRIIDAQNLGYDVILVFFWLKNVDLAHERVRKRVLEGGHNVPKDVIDRRYISGIKNLFSIYFELADEVLIFDNSEGKHLSVAAKIGGSVVVYDDIKYEQIKTIYNEYRTKH